MLAITFLNMCWMLSLWLRVCWCQVHSSHRLPVMQGQWFTLGLQSLLGAWLQITCPWGNGDIGCHWVLGPSAEVVDHMHSWGSWPCILGLSAVVGGTFSQEGGGSGLHMLTRPSDVAQQSVIISGVWDDSHTYACPWSSCRQCLDTWEWVEKETSMEGTHFLSCAHQQWCLASLSGPRFFLDFFSCDTLHGSPLRLSSHGQTQSSLQGLTSIAWTSVPGPHLPHWVSGQASQAEECHLALTLCAGLFLLCLLQACCCLLLRGSKDPPLFRPITPSVGEFSVKKPFLFHSSISEAQVLSWFPYLSFFFCSTQFYGGFLALLEM